MNFWLFFRLTSRFTSLYIVLPPHDVTSRTKGHCLGPTEPLAFSVSCETLTSNSSACLICFSSYSLLFLLQLDITRFTFISFYGSTAQFGWATPLLRLLDHTQFDTHTHTHSSFYGSTAQFGWATPLLRLLDHTQLDTHTHSSFYGSTAQFGWATPLLRLLDHTQFDTHTHTHILLFMAQQPNSGGPHHCWGF